MKIFLWACFLVVWASGEQISSSNYPVKGLSLIGYLQNVNMFLRDIESQSQCSNKIQTPETNSILCGNQQQLLFVDQIEGTKFWVIGCEGQVQLRSLKGVVDSFQFPGHTTDLSYTLAYPYLDIYFNSSTIFSCLVDSLILECSEIPISEQVIKYDVLTTRGYTMSTKIVTYNRATSHIFVYCEQPREFRITADVYSATQFNYTLYLWTSKGLYMYDHQSQNLEFVMVWPYQPRERGYSLGYFQENLLFLTSNYQLMVYEMENSSIYQYNDIPSWRVYEDERGVIVIQKGAALMFYKIPPEQNNLTTQLPIPWNKTQEYAQNYENNTQQEKQNHENNTQQEKQEQIAEVNKICWESCQWCRQNKCIRCSVGSYLTKKGKCVEKVHFVLIRSFISFPYSSMIFKMIFFEFMEEYWFYQYQKYNYSPSVYPILQYIGNANRNKFIPPYVRGILPDLHEAFVTGKGSWGFTNMSNFTSEEYYQKEKQPINFTLNASKMYLWNYILCLIIYTIQRVSYYFLSRCRISKISFKRSTTIWLMIVMFIQGHVQYISFLFFQQIRQQPSALVFQDKANLVIAVLFMFVALIYTVGSFVLFSYLLSKKKFRILFPNSTGNTLIDMLVLTALGPGRNFFLGFVQAFNNDFALQMFLLLGMNFLILIFIGYLPEKYKKLYKLNFRIVSLVLIIVFLLCGLFNHYSLIFSSDSFDLLQLVCLGGCGAICFIDTIFGFLHFVVDAVFFICGGCNRKRIHKKITKTTSKNPKSAVIEGKAKKDPLHDSD